MTAAEILAAADLAESHWGKRIIAAERRGYFTRNDRTQAFDWKSCPCGRLGKQIRRVAGVPADDRLIDAGSAFGAAAFVDSFARAADLLVAIERRAAELLAEARP